MKRIKLEIAYDGTNYCGWQTQPNEVTVEGTVNKCLSTLLKEEIKVIGASRTDSGVHAFGNVAVFDTETRIPAEKISYALNQWLPEDIKVQSSCEVADDFHPRKTECVKTYEYRILNHPFMIPTLRFYTHFVYQSMDLDAMQKAAGYLVGEHDFKSFCSVNTQVKDTVRTIYSLDVIREGKEVILRVKGNGFLYNMVRILTGTLIQIGTGLRKPEEILAMLEAKDRQASGPTAPACGLTLVQIKYKQ